MNLFSIQTSPFVCPVNVKIKSKYMIHCFWAANITKFISKFQMFFSNKNKNKNI